MHSLDTYLGQLHTDNMIYIHQRSLGMLRRVLEKVTDGVPSSGHAPIVAFGCGEGWGSHTSDMRNEGYSVFLVVIIYPHG